jgi:hypothetical protein
MHVSRFSFESPFDTTHCFHAMLRRPAMNVIVSCCVQHLLVQVVQTAACERLDVQLLLTMLHTPW